MAEEAFVQPRRGNPVGIVDGLGVDGQCQTRVGMSKPSLHSLDIHTCDDQLRGIGPPQIVKAGADDTGRLDRW